MDLNQKICYCFNVTVGDIKKEIESFYGRYAENNNLTLQEVHKRLNPSELKSAKEEITSVSSSSSTVLRNSKNESSPFPA